MEATEFPLAPKRGVERYTILNRIGEGSFAVTYRAHDLALDRIVALKLLRPQYATDPAFLTRFTREARAAALVNHPNVVQVYDYGTRDEVPFVVLQFIPGRDLKEFNRREGPRTPDEAVRIGAQILRGLEAIHAVGLIHRDIKPQNVLLDFDLNAHVSDFGIALNPANSMLTGDGTTLGTPSYMAPEQARGETVTRSADLYAVGVMLFEMLTGRLPFNGDNPLAVMLAHVQNTPPTPSSLASQPIPPALEAIVLRALSKNPRDRAPSALAMAQECEATLVPSRHAARAEGRIVPFPSRVGTPTTPLSSAHDPMSSTVATPPAIPARDNAQRRRAVWLAPLGVIALILMIWGGVKAIGVGDGNGNGNGTGTNPQLGALLTSSPTQTPSSTESAATTATVVSTRPSLILGNATETPRRENTATSEPTSTSRPIEPTRTATVEPSETARPSETPRPTRTLRPPTASPTDPPETADQPTIAPSEGDESGNNEGQGSEGEAEDGESGQPGTDGQDGQSNQGQGNAGNVESNRAPVSLSFGPEQWSGGYHRADSGFLGRPWVAIYGAQSGLGQISLRFDLDARPKDEATLTITGINDEWASPNPLVIEINGVIIFEGPCPFPAWDGAGNGANAVWGTVSWTIPKNALRKGDNQLVIRNLTNSGNTNSPPYVDISTTTIDA